VLSAPVPIVLTNRLPHHAAGVLCRGFMGGRGEALETVGSGV
jgi:hypothetical protein